MTVRVTADVRLQAPRGADAHLLTGTEIWAVLPQFKFLTLSAQRIWILNLGLTQIFWTPKAINSHFWLVINRP